MSKKRTPESPSPSPPPRHNRKQSSAQLVHPASSSAQHHQISHPHPQRNAYGVMTQSGPWHTLMTRCTRLFLLDTSDARLPGYSILQSHQGAKTACHRHRRSVPAEAGWKWPACTHGCTTRPASQHALCLAAPASSAATRIYEPPSRSRNARTTTTTTRVRREKRNGKEEGGGGRRRRKGGREEGRKRVRKGGRE